VANAPNTAPRTIAYPLGTSDRERLRLVRQAELLHDVTADTFRFAGLAPGMRALEIGSGAGDVAMLAADLVGENGSVIAIDRDPNNLAFARQRVAEAGRRNITFRQADISSFTERDRFDAVIGRYILLYILDPVAALRQLAATLAPGGIVAFVEPDFSTPVRSFPHAPLYEQACKWLYAVVEAAGMHLDSGIGIGKTFVDAGLPFPQLICRPWIGGGPGNPLYEYVAETLRSVLPSAEQYGILKPGEVQIDTLAQRLEQEAVSRGSLLIGCPVIGAWSKLP
jgi:ubiquinone/menaquinone biosynthesis C-methylase UbiE